MREYMENERQAIERKLRTLAARLQRIEDVFDSDIRDIWDEIADIDARLESSYIDTAMDIDAELKRLNGIE